MPQDLNEIQKTTENKLRQRKIQLLKQYENVSDDEIPENVLTELTNIQNLLEKVSFEEVPNQIFIRLSEIEKYYYSMMRRWLSSHLDALTSEKFSGPEIYKVALHFFVDEVVMNPKNNNLSMNVLKTKMDNLNNNESEKKIVRALEDLKNVTMYSASLGYMVADLSREFPNGITEQLKINQDTDITENSFSRSLNSFVEKRNLDKQNNTKQKNKLGFQR